jgi:hypothetical protein
MNILSNSLTPSKSQPIREWSFIEFGPDSGTLTINTQRTTNRAAKVYSETYDVEEDYSEHLPARTFLLAKRSDGTIYAVTLTPTTDRCTCDAAKCGMACKHIDTMRDLLDHGGLLSAEDIAAMTLAHG